MYREIVWRFEAENALVCGVTYAMRRLFWRRHSTRLYIPIVVLLVLLLGQTGEAWETSNKAVPAVLSCIIFCLDGF